MDLLLVTLFLISIMSPSLSQTDLCNNLPEGQCFHNQSGLCGHKNYPTSCVHQLHQMVTSSSEQCQFKKLAEHEGCGTLQPQPILSPEKLLVGIHLHYYKTWMGERGLVNLTFPSPGWNDMKFQYKASDQLLPYCRKFSLQNMSLPLNGTLLYFDCVVLNVPNNNGLNVELTVETSEGEGGSYLFRIPNGSSINPWKTSIETRPVFFYLHTSHIGQTSHLPVTVQSVDPVSYNVSYDISLVKCGEVQNGQCHDPAVLHAKSVHEPEMLSTFKDGQWTVELSLWGNPGSYAVTVQISTKMCHPLGCRISTSPIFEIEPSYLWVWISLSFGFVLIFLFTFLIMVKDRLKTNKEMLVNLSKKQPKLLLIYLPENHSCLKFVFKFADFLEANCYIDPFLVDRAVGSQDPYRWTREHMNQCDRLLFLVPGDPAGEGMSHVRYQWTLALQYFSGQHFTTHQLTHKAATLKLPFSGYLPNEISHVQWFRLLQDMPSLVTWLHDGSWLDNLFFWRPCIKASAQDETGHTWKAVMNAVEEASKETHRVTHKSTQQRNPPSCIDINELTILKREGDNGENISENISETENGHHESCSVVLDPGIEFGDEMFAEREESEQSSIDDDVSSQHDLNDSMFCN